MPPHTRRRGNYGAFLMDQKDVVQRLVSELATRCSVPVTAKIRVFPRVDDTLAYARMIEAAGARLLAVHGRTREQKSNSATRADWDQIRAVKQVWAAHESQGTFFVSAHVCLVFSRCGAC
jgi:tRNA-dihydrouridine synthase 1